MTFNHVSRCKKLSQLYSNRHSDLHFLTLTAKNVYIVEIVNIIIIKNRIFVFFFGFSVGLFFGFLNTDVGFGVFKLSRYSVSVTDSALVHNRHGPKIGGCCDNFEREGSWVPIEHTVAWAEPAPYKVAS